MFDFDITRATRLAAILLPSFALIVLPAPYAAAQSIDSTVEEQVEDDITDTVEEQVEDDVAGTVDDDVQAQVESDVAGAVEEQVQNQVEADVSGTVEDQVESGVASTVEQQIQSGIVDSIEREVESGVTGTVEDDVAASLHETVEQELERLLGDEVGDELEELVDQVAGLAGELGIENIGEAIESAVERMGRIADGEEGGDADDANAGDERYVAGIDELGRAAENDVWLVLVPDQYKTRIRNWGFTVREQRELDGLDRVLLRVDAPANRDIAQAALELALDAPGTNVDFNHVYHAAQGPSVDGAVGAAGRVGQGGRAPRSRDASLEIGIVDSQVAADHEALARADIAQQDFVPFAGTRPTAHGTAVASIVVGDSESRPGVLAGGRLHAASVFFEDEAGNEVATASSLVSALEWLIARGVGVVNMSLTGPPNRVLETAIEAATGPGHAAVVVAAVGNNGPSGEPLYPAAYERVVGVTAVDAAHRVYHYANRGRQVMFAAPGVDVPIARSRGGYGKQSGTSMAAPYAAAMIARSLAANATPPGRVLASLKAAAVDLGDKDFDEIYGFGLIAPLDSPRRELASATPNATEPE